MERLAVKITSVINSCLIKDGLEVQKIKLGIEILLINISKFLFIVVLSLIFNLYKETIVMLIAFACIRKSSFGIHSRTSLGCTAICTIMFVLGSYACQYIKINNYEIMCIFCVVISFLYKYAPADSENHPLVGIKLRIKLKKEAIITAIVMMLISIIISDTNLKMSIVLAAIYAVATILPITYKLFKRRCRNYEEYERYIN